MACVVEETCFTSHSLTYPLSPLKVKQNKTSVFLTWLEQFCYQNLSNLTRAPTIMPGPGTVIKLSDPSILKNLHNTGLWMAVIG